MPFDLPEAESELVAGWLTEYSGMRWGTMLALSEYGNVTVVCAIITTLWFGGWQGPGVDAVPLLGVVWFTLKVYAFILVMMWIRATLPRMRIDQLMSFCWKGLIPLALVNVLVVAGLALAVASGALRHEIELILAQAGLADCFAAIVSAEDVSAGKPSPEGFLCALERLRARLPDLAPRDCLVVEDSQPGVEGARRAGMRCLAVTNSYPAAALGGADLIVSSLAEAGWDRLAALF
jgi:hypothetical protein